MLILEIVLMFLAGIWQGIRMDFNLLELAVIAAGWYAWRKRGWRPRWNRIPNPANPARWAVAIAVGVVAIRLLLVPVLPAPVPLVTDEFSHLLLADTLLHGRLANPPHPFWPHFESLHTIHQPTYASNYFPGPAAILALARLLTGNPWHAVLAECAAFLAVLYWSLRGWMPARWSLFAVLLSALRFGIGSYWVNAFHGGFLPALGGALVFGAFPRLRRQSNLRDSSLLGLGLLIMALSRPYEGALFSLPIVLRLAWDHRARVTALLKLALPIALCTAAAGLLLTSYMKGVTGNPFVSAYNISRQMYGWPMGFSWTTPPQIQHRHPEFKAYYEHEIIEHNSVSDPVEFLEYITLRIQEYWRFFVGPVFTIPLLFLPQVWRRRRLFFFAGSGAALAVMSEGAASPHYLAPATAVIVAILVESIRHLHAARWGLTGALPYAMAAVLILRIAAQATGLPYSQTVNYQSWCCRVEGNLEKYRVTRQLEQLPQNHLVFVRTKTDIFNFFQWVYNLADIDAARIVWARDLGDARNAQLIRHYNNSRSVWMLDPNVTPARLEPYTPAP